jgi:glutamate-1-semialdehyde 2,1-aminomutase
MSVDALDPRTAAGNPTPPAPLSNAALFERARAVIPGGHQSPGRRLGRPHVFTRAQGPWLYDVEGRRYHDFHCAFGANVIGHRHPEVTARVAALADRIDLVGAGTLDVEIEVAEALVECIPCAEQVALCNSGSEATYHALRLARAATGRSKIIKFQGGYHGWHDYVAMNAQSTAGAIDGYDPFSAGMLELAARETLILPYNDAQAVSDCLDAHRGQVAAIIVEPIAHNMGSVAGTQAFLGDLRRLTLQHGTVLIFDEVITGFRHALGGYQSIVGITPDLATFGKAVSSGYPVGVLTGQRQLMERVGRYGEGSVLMGGTFNGAPSTLAAILATLDILARPGTYEQLFALGDRMRCGLAGIIDRLGVPAQVAGFGSVWLPYFFTGAYSQYRDLLRNDDAADLAFRNAMIDHGLIGQPLPLKRLYLSLSHTDAIIDEALDVMETILRKTSAQRVP